MKTSILFLNFFLLCINCFSQKTFNTDEEIMNSGMIFMIIIFCLLAVAITVIQQVIFRRKMKKIKMENNVRMEEIIKECDEKISKSEAEMLKTLNVSITEIHSDYMNKIVQIRSDIESHRSKILFLMENNNEMKQFYEEIINEHFNPIIQSLN